MKTTQIRLILVGILLLLSLSSCNMPKSAETSTPEINVTQAYQTISARLTQVLALTPSSASPSTTDSGIQTPTLTPTVISTPHPSPTPVRSPTSSTSCDQAAPGNPIDVTIPDDTEMQPNQSFTKIWRLQNVGSCTWTRDYAVTFFSGEQMGAPASVSLAGNVAPGQSVDISVDMVAPSKSGKYQGNWKLRNASNVLFAIGPNGSAPFWVRIIVVITTTATPTVTTTPVPTTPAPTNTATPTPVVGASGSASLSPGDKLDLDTIQVNGGNPPDLNYELNGSGQHLLIPQNNAIIGLYGNAQPSPAICQATTMTTGTVILENTPIVGYLCYRTDKGFYGYLRLSSLNTSTGVLSVDAVTWASP